MAKNKGPYYLFYDRFHGVRFIRSHASCLLLVVSTDFSKAPLTLLVTSKQWADCTPQRSRHHNTFRNQQHRHKAISDFIGSYYSFSLKKNTQLGATHNLLTIHNFGHYSDFAIESDEMG